MLHDGATVVLFHCSRVPSLFPLDSLDILRPVLLLCNLAPSLSVHIFVFGFSFGFGLGARVPFEPRSAGLSVFHHTPLPTSTRTKQGVRKSERSDRCYPPFTLPPIPPERSTVPSLSPLSSTPKPNNSVLSLHLLSIRSPLPSLLFPTLSLLLAAFPPLQRVSVALVVVAGNIDPSLLLEPSSAPNLPHLSLPLLLSPLINPVALTCNPSIHYILNSHSPPRNKSTLSLLDLVF